MTKILLCDCSILTTQETYEKAYRLVSAFRQKKADACKAKMDRARCIGAGLLLREAFFSCCKHAGEACSENEPVRLFTHEIKDLLKERSKEEEEFYLELGERADSHGRSHWEGEGSLWKDLFWIPYVSISHSGELAAVALSDQPVGLDIQKTRTFTKGMIKRVLSDSELAAYERFLQGASGLQEDRAMQEAQAYLLFTWCKKEAAAKLDGRGIFAMLSEVSKDGWEENARIQIDRLSLPDGYAGAVAGRCAKT
ncbi:MAG: 4'-phosphopantetheinyl transferase superfamily protein [Lachnospiraceae bacterium]|nr:4'-phosphopantetheinyl transferase superfamily protein [Lachnospiraceae bacterium]